MARWRVDPPWLSLGYVYEFLLISLLEFSIPSFKEISSYFLMEIPKIVFLIPKLLKGSQDMFCKIIL